MTCRHKDHTSQRCTRSAAIGLNSGPYQVPFKHGAAKFSAIDLCPLLNAEHEAARKESAVRQITGKPAANRTSNGV